MGECVHEGSPTLREDNNPADVFNQNENSLGETNHTDSGSTAPPWCAGDYCWGWRQD